MPKFGVVNWANDIIYMAKLWLAACMIAACVLLKTSYFVLFLLPSGGTIQCCDESYLETVNFKYPEIESSL